MGTYYRISPGILATIAGFLQFFVTTIIVKSLGILLVSMGGELRTDTWELGSIFALIECVSDVLAPIAGPIGTFIGHRPAVMLGGALVSVGLVAASQSTNVLHIALLLNLPLASCFDEIFQLTIKHHVTWLKYLDLIFNFFPIETVKYPSDILDLFIGYLLSFPTATGYCLTNVLTRTALGEYYDRRSFALASGITKTGVSVSLVCVPPLVQVFNDTYGWRGTMLLVGGICAHLVVCGALLMPLTAKKTNTGTSKGEYEPLPDSGCSNLPSSFPPSNCGVAESLRDLLLRAGTSLNLPLLKSCKFWVVTIIFVSTRITKSAWIIYFVPHAVAKGFSQNAAAVMVTLAGVGHLVGTVVVSVVLFKEKVASTSAMLVSSLLLAVPFFLDPWLNSGWSLSLGGLFVMSAVGSVYALSDIMVKEYFGYEKMASAYGWMGFFSGIFRVSSGFIPGWIYDHSGSYDLAFIILGTIQITSLVPLLINTLTVGDALK
ncbi:monocarboxylate transporter 12-like [Patiria miniata]|uniref:Major facilitator superfamily (MFS) profile domain-containing protein n=1 Tax=Patiria miniata TaxID=46514 RepID=A0A914ACV5_PATMI|nr:monocarboxylate transporter 12-like [Patiria miniata]